MHGYLSRLNPYILVLYYTLIMVFGVMIRNPIHLGIMLVSGIIMAIVVAGVKPTLRTLGYSLIFVLLIAFINPLVSHQGVTVIWRAGDFTITLESLVYGLVAGEMFLTVFMWFVSFNVLMTGDKYIYVLGRVLPSLSLMISLVLRLIPELNRDYEREKMSLVSMGMFKDKGFSNKCKLSVCALKGIIRRSIENSSIRADSMEARGYGIAHRSSYLKCKVRIYDWVTMFLTILCGVGIIWMHILGGDMATYYPIINIKYSGTYTILSIVFIMVYVSIMLVAELVEEVRWKQYLVRSSV